MKNRLLEIDRARQKASALLDEFGVESPEHLQIEAFAHRLGIRLAEARLEGASAQLVVGQRGAQILLSDRLTDPGDRRWSIAHEVGHYVLGHTAPAVAELCVPHPHHHDAEEDAANGFASAVLMPPAVVAAFCDRFPMTLDVPMQLAAICGVPWLASALRIVESSWRVCALVFSQHGRIQWIAPSLPCLMLCGDRLRAGRPLGGGSAAGRFFGSGIRPSFPEVVPSAAWIDACGPEVRTLEHSVANDAHNAVMTILWDPTDTGTTRPEFATLPNVIAARDYLLEELGDRAAAGRRSKA